MSESDRFTEMVTSGDLFESTGSQIFFSLMGSGLVFTLWLMYPFPLLPVVVPMGIICGFCAITFPSFVSALYLTLTFFKLYELSLSLSPLSYAISAGSILIMIAFFWHLFLTRRIRLELQRPQTFLFVFWLLVTAGVVLARDHSLALDVWLQYSKVVLIALAITQFMSSISHVRLFVVIFTLGAILTSGGAVLNSWIGGAFVEGTRVVAGDLSAGTLSNPNEVALLLLVALPFAIEAVLRREGVWQILVGVIGTIAILYAIVLTQSRGGLLGLLAVFAVMGGRFIKSKAALIFIGVMLAVVLYSAMGIADRSSGGINDVAGESAQDRLYAWRAAINMATVFPLNGVGIGNFAAQVLDYSPDEMHQSITAHSIWFLTLGEVGIPGLIVFVTIIASMVRSNIKCIRGHNGKAEAEIRSYSCAILASLVGFLVSGSFVSEVYEWPLYVLMILTVVLARISAQRDAGCVKSANQ